MQIDSQIVQALTFSVIFNRFGLIMNIWNMKRMQKLTSCSMCSAGGRTATTSFAPSCTPSTFAIRSRLNPQLRFPWRRMCRFPNAVRHCALRRLTVPPQKRRERALQSMPASHRKPGSGVPPQMRRPCFPACRRFTARFRKRSFSPSQRAPVRTFRSALQAAQRSAKGLANGSRRFPAWRSTCFL